MSKTVGYFTVLAAIVLIVCSATTLFWSAYLGAGDPWQRWVQGTQIVAVIMWEAGAVIAITYCFNHGHRFIGLAGTVLLILAMGYTLSEEEKQQSGTQEAVMSKRAVENGKLELVKSELDKAIGRRDKLQKLDRLTNSQQSELSTLRREISGLKDRWEAQIETPHATLTPGVALIARWTKLNVADSADLNPLIKMAFWTMARVFALPLAMFGFSLLGASRKPREAAKAPRGIDVAAPPVTPALIPQARAEYSFKRFASPPTSDDPPPADAKPVAELPGNGSGGGGAPEAKLLRLVPKQPEKPEPELSVAEAKALEAIEAVEAFAAAHLSEDKLIRVRAKKGKKSGVQSGGTAGPDLMDMFRQWARSSSEWSHLATCGNNPLGKAMSAVFLESGRNSKSGRIVYGVVMKDQKKRAIG